jgi:hypothetical protein
MDSQGSFQLNVIGERKQEREPLILRRAGITRRVNALFKAMSTDFLLREQFVTDPAQVLHKYVEGSELPPQTASVTNQLLYSVLSNRKLLDWLKDYAIKHRGRQPARQEFMNDFGRAVVDYGGDHVVLSLIRSSIEQEGLMAFGPLQAFAITHSSFIASGFLVSTDQRTGLAQDQRNVSSFQNNSSAAPPATASASSSLGSGADSGAGSDADSGADSGADSDSGADFGADASEIRVLGPMYARVTIDALVAYAGELARIGALNSTEAEGA